MKPFVFRLQTALDLRLKEEEMLKEKLCRATEDYKKRLKALEELRVRLTEIQDVIRGKSRRDIDVSEIVRYEDFIPVLAGRIETQKAAVEESRQEMERIRHDLVETMKDRKVLEKLRTGHYQEYVKESLREEQKQIDEMATTGYVHKDSVM
ncbi:MAG: flagellar export protein FliJ [Firmicutes bacterium HGW-Firmicutes-14]|nr:MAG: flagellar export protein FliJ [Firmicutes bacterium HGW-Firmicutes-14]